MDFILVLLFKILDKVLFYENIVRIAITMIDCLKNNNKNILIIYKQSYILFHNNSKRLFSVFKEPITKKGTISWK